MKYVVVVMVLYGDSRDRREYQKRPVLITLPAQYTAGSRTLNQLSKSAEAVAQNWCARRGVKFIRYEIRAIKKSTL